jgi:hypothetical protein
MCDVRLRVRGLQFNRASFMTIERNREETLRITMINMLRALSLCVGLLVVTVGLFGAEQESEETQRTLEAAVRAGKTTEVHPYLLLQSADARSTVGAVYTQFVRVARYVWLARKNGHEIELADIPESVKRRELHVVLPMPPHIGVDGPAMMAAIHRHPSAQPAGVSVYFVQSERRLTPATAVITPAAFEKTVGAIPIERAGLVGMFPAEVAQRKVPEFCIYDADRAGNVHVICGYIPGPLR